MSLTNSEMQQCGASLLPTELRLKLQTSEGNDWGSLESRIGTSKLAHKGGENVGVCKSRQPKTIRDPLQIGVHKPSPSCQRIIYLHFHVITLISPRNSAVPCYLNCGVAAARRLPTASRSFVYDVATPKKLCLPRSRTGVVLDFTSLPCLPRTKRTKYLRMGRVSRVWSR